MGKIEKMLNLAVQDMIRLVRGTQLNPLCGLDKTRKPQIRHRLQWQTSFSDVAFVFSLASLWPRQKLLAIFAAFV
jgi:hypothetical protein